jgi:hypothetical protein
MREKIACMMQLGDVCKRYQKGCCVHKSNNFRDEGAFLQTSGVKLSHQLLICHKLAGSAHDVKKRFSCASCYPKTDLCGCCV